jgi:hypothetical protein
MAGFEVSANGRFWVSTEGYRLAGLAGLIAGGVVTVVGIVLVARKLLTY